MTLDEWLLDQHMTTSAFMERIGCSRTTAVKMKKELPVCSLYAERVKSMTKGKIVIPVCEKGATKIDKG